MTLMHKTGPSLLKGIREAIPMQIEQAAVFAKFTKSLPRLFVEAWTQAVEDWEKNPEQQNPFKTTVPHMCNLPLLPFLMAD